MTSQILFGKGKAEGSWLAPWALSTAGCFVCWTKVVEAEPGQLPGSLRESFLCVAAESEAKDRSCRKCRFQATLGHERGPRLVCTLRLARHCLRYVRALIL